MLNMKLPNQLETNNLIIRPYKTSDLSDFIKFITHCQYREKYSHIKCTFMKTISCFKSTKRTMVDRITAEIGSLETLTMQ